MKKASVRSVVTVAKISEIRFQTSENRRQISDGRILNPADLKLIPKVFLLAYGTVYNSSY